MNRYTFQFLRRFAPITNKRTFSNLKFSREPLLFTPGPLTTSPSVKQAMLVDLGSRDARMMRIIQTIRDRLLTISHVSRERGYDSILMQGSGTFIVESVITSTIAPPSEGGKLLIVANGGYGERIMNICKKSGIDHTMLRYDETKVPIVEDLIQMLQKEPFTHVAMIHHETTAGILNPVEAFGKAIHQFNPNISFIVDSMSGFGAYDLDMEKDHVHYLISSANKNLEGVPGFAFAICNRQRLEREGQYARSLSLDLLDQLKGFEKNGQFRFTPPTHALIAFDQALNEFELEGGVEGRFNRYNSNYQILKQGMLDMGFTTLIKEPHQSCIISTFLYPNDPNFNFQTFYRKLSDKGIVIYPGKLTKSDCFRIGSIGRLMNYDMEHLVMAIRHVLIEMNVRLPVTQISAQ